MAAFAVSNLRLNERMKYQVADLVKPVCFVGFLQLHMHPLLGKTLFRMLMFHAYGLFLAWIFTFIEKRDESSFDRMERTLKELKIEINTKYNMTDDDFERFVKMAALS